MSINLLIRENCPACQKNRSFKLSTGVFSPWIEKLAGEELQPLTKIMECKDCETVFTNLAYSDKIMRALYGNYRSETYQKIRQEYEPGYTTALNNSLNSGADWFIHRQAVVTKALFSAGIATKEIKICVDFGGGHGGVMPNFPRRYVFEANSKVESSGSIQVLSDWEQVQKLQPDLLMCCGVLEHVCSPPELMSFLITSEAEHFYLEVPAGKPIERVEFPFKSLVLKILFRYKTLWRMVQRLERRKTTSRFKRIFPMRISEHLQFFSEQGMRNLINQSGLELLTISIQNHNNGLTDSENLSLHSIISAVARRVKTL